MPRTSYRARLIVYLLSFVGFAAAAAVVVMLALGYRLDFKDAKLDKTGLLVLNSVPRGAYITLNGAVASERTTARLSLDPGRYQVKVDRPGVIPWEKDIDLDPGEAILEENILLFAKPTQRRELAGGPVTAYAISPNERAVYYLTTEAGGTGLWKSGVGNSDTPERLAGLPPAFARPTGMAVSSDSSRVAVSTATETAVAGPNPKDPSVAPVGGTVRFVPGLPNQLVFNRGTTLLNRTADGKETVLEEGVTTWATSGEAIYAVRTDGTLIRREGRTGQRREVPDFPLTELRPTSGADILYGRDAANVLYTLRDDRPLKIAEGVEHYASNGSGELLTYTSHRELTLWKRSTKAGTLVTRSSVPYSGLAVVTDGYYLLYSLAGQVHSIAIDGSNDQVVAPAGRGPLMLAGDTTLVTAGAEGSPLALERLLAED